MEMPATAMLKRAKEIWIDPNVPLLGAARDPIAAPISRSEKKAVTAAKPIDAASLVVG